jgi:aspartate racemase
MKTIGLIGGMSWESSIEYYRLINEYTRQKLGGLHSAKSVMVSVDFAEVETLQHEGRWDEAAILMVQSAEQVTAAGADCLVLCTNTMHKLADAIQSNLEIPFLHIADATAQRIVAAGLTRIGLLGTRFTMEQDFYKGRLINQYGLDVLVPNAADQEIVHRIIYDELCLGKILPESHAEYVRIMQSLAAAGAQGIILGCTEITLLVKDSDSPLPLFDTTRIHAESAVEWALL